MKILVTGGTGFIGSALCSRLLEDKHDIILLTREPNKVKAPLHTITDLGHLENDTVIDVVINLAGEPIANKRWSQKQRQKIISSRIDITQNIIEFFKRVEQKPGLLINGSAIGYYGIDDSNISIGEEATGDDSFSSQLCQKWESVAMKAESFGIRTCLLRTGIVLGKGGGALEKMLLPFRMGFGGKIGDGKQWMSWIHLDDLVSIILYCMDNNHIKGAVNGTAPNPVTNETFTKALGKALQRPTIFPLPTIVVNLLMGQMGNELLLKGKKVLPTKILKAGYQFQCPNLEEALVNAV